MPLLCDLPIQEPVGHPAGCRCCGELAPALWAVYGGLMAAGVPGVVQTMKDDGADPDARPEEDPTLTEELLLAALLATAFLTLTKKALAKFWKQMRKEFSEASLTAALDDATRAASAPLTRPQREELDRIIERAIANGALDAGPDVTEAPDKRTPTRPPRPTLPPATGPLGRRDIGMGTSLETDESTFAMWSNLRRVTQGTTGAFFEQVIAPTLTRMLRPMLDDARAAEGRGETYVADFTEVRGLIDAQVSQTSRWRVVANASVSRAYHFGFLRAAEISNVEFYVWVAVGDERVCPICTELDGKTFPVRGALDLMDRVAESDDPDAVKTILPWPKKVEDVRGPVIMVPPAHGRCRCTIRIVRRTVSVAP